MEKLKNFFHDVKDVILMVFSIIGIILGGLFWYEKKQNEVQRAENLNAETKGKVEVIDSQIKSIEDKTKAKENEPVTQQDLLDFLNNKPK